MNSYFDHSASFYGSSHNGTPDLHHHQSAYRSFHPSLSMPGQNGAYHQASWNNSTFNHTDTPSPYDAACKLYYGSNHSVAFKSDCSLTKEQSVPSFKSPTDHQMSTSNSWHHHSSPLRTSSATISPSMGPTFTDSTCTRSNVSDCTACCNNANNPSSGKFWFQFFFFLFLSFYWHFIVCCLLIHLNHA